MYLSAISLPSIFRTFHFLYRSVPFLAYFRPFCTLAEFHTVLCLSLQISYIYMYLFLHNPYFIVPLLLIPCLLHFSLHIQYLPVPFLTYPYLLVIFHIPYIYMCTLLAFSLSCTFRTFLYICFIFRTSCTFACIFREPS